MIGNIIAFVVFFKNSNHHTALFLTALAASDIGQNIFYFAVNKITLLEFEHKYATCQCVIFLLTYFVTNSTWQVTIMTMEKFIAVRFTFKFRKFCSQKIVARAIGIVFFTSALVAFPMIFAVYVDDGYRCSTFIEKTQFNLIYAWFYWILQFFIPLSTLSILNILILKSIRKSRERVLQFGNNSPEISLNVMESAVKEVSNDVIVSSITGNKDSNLNMNNAKVYNMADLTNNTVTTES